MMNEFPSRVRAWHDHRWAPDRMSAYLDGELAPSPLGRMDRHTQHCPECRRLLEGLRRTLGALHRLPTSAGGAEPLAIAASVRKRLDEPPAS
jgi:anti-sigma factor RsiW